jgi:5-methylcytosine-specific restriction enzyme A
MSSSLLGYSEHASHLWQRWYSTAAWRKRRAHQLTIEPLCRMCLAEGRTTPATVADHVVPHRGNPGLFWQGELQSLCATCHSRFKQSQEAARRVLVLQLLRAMLLAAFT